MPHVDARAWYAGRDDAGKYAVAHKSTMLQTAYLILALRALGLDTGPMGGFDAAAIDTAFFAGTTWRTQLVINVGYGDRARLHPRNPRLALDEFTRFI
jgi:3-hydroxypropanoate dehydrogenase